MRMRTTAIVLGVLATVVAARAEYPDRPVTFVVPYAAGGATDLLARNLAQKLEARLGKPFIIENKTGASSAIAGAFTAKAPPEGHTILMATSTTMAINVAVMKKLAYSPTDDLTPVALIATSPFALVVNKDLGVSSVADLVALAKSKPDALAYGSSGPGSAHHLDMQLFASMTGIKLTHIPYKGTLPALNDVVAGHIQLQFADLTAALPLIRAGSLRALGVSSAKRIPGVELPPLAEAGVPGYDASAWQMVVAPAETPREIVATLHRHLRAIQEDPEFVAAIGQRGMAPLLSTSPEELQAFVRAEIVRWGRIAADAGVASSQ